MLGSNDLVAFVATTDIDQARQFYAEVLGLSLVDDTPFAAVFDAHGTMLRVTPVPELVVAGYTVLGWEVADIHETVSGLAARGVVFNRYDGMDQDDLGVWASPSGAQVAWFKDPDGNTLSLTQM